MSLAYVLEVAGFVANLSFSSQVGGLLKEHFCAYLLCFEWIFENAFGLVKAEGGEK